MKPADRAPGEGARKPPGAKGKAGRKAEEQRCPICNKPVSAAYKPFCSKRCADVDLSRWLGGRYAIPGEPVEEDSEERED